MQLLLFAPLPHLRESWWENVSTLRAVHARHFELRFSPNYTLSVSVGGYREIVINSSPRGAAIGFSTLPNPPTPSRKWGCGACKLAAAARTFNKDNLACRSSATEKHSLCKKMLTCLLSKLFRCHYGCFQTRFSFFTAVSQH
jgi:hypothetical protein